MEKKEVVWTLPAKEDLHKIYNYLSEVSEIIAEKIIQKILSRTILLEKGFTKIGQEEPLLKHRKK
ncbi:MAG: type II toxin-antitoxin system RelE/ParE family toxin [Bacteroidia bacterium]